MKHNASNRTERRIDKPAAEIKATAKTKPAHDLTLGEYTDQFVNNHKYREKYEKAGMLDELVKMAKKEWVKALKEQAQIGNLSDKSIDSYIETFGEGSLHSTFRGVLAKGIEGWKPESVRNAPKETAFERLTKRFNKLQQQLLEPDYKVSKAEKAKIRAKIKRITQTLQASKLIPTPQQQPATEIKPESKPEAPGKA